MTRATLLRLLAHPTALNGADVRALEELAEAFPYCQTAHLLLAKAAHDQGSMLAGQRLRRAATYAADRGLLRQLVEAAPVEELAEALPNTSAAPDYTSPQAVGYLPDGALPPAAAPATLLLEDKPAPEIAPALRLTATEASADEAPAAAADASVAPAPLGEQAPAELLPLGPPAIATPPAEAPLAAPEATATSEAAATSETAPPTTTSVDAAATPLRADAPAPAPELPENDAPAFELLSTAPEELAITSELPAAVASLHQTAEAAAQPADKEATAGPATLGDELPPQAPPIRPPAEAEAARQEFGLSPAEPAEITAYQLPELELAITIPLTPADATPRLPPFSGVADVAYAPSEGSRFGYCLVPAALPGGEAAAPLVPGAALPLPGEFFVPDALVLAHVATQPLVSSTTTTDLINSFLLRTPSNMRRRAQPPVKASEQADLSIRSTRAAPDLASESLARILAQQGKLAQAIAIYERLMVKNPEKMAYFAAQIDLLRP